MSTERKIIRNTLTGLLKGRTSVGDNVHSSRIIPQIDDNLPAIHVYSQSETVDPNSIANRSYFRTISMAIEIITKGISGSVANDLADDIGSEVEAIIDIEDQNSNGTLGCLIEEAVMTGSDVELQPDGDSAICSVRLTYSIKYVKDAALVPESNFSDANTLGVDWDVGTANDPDPEAQDLIDLT